MHQVDDLFELNVKLRYQKVNRDAVRYTQMKLQQIQQQLHVSDAQSSHHPAVYVYFNYALQPFKAYCAIWVRRSNFRHQASPRVSPRQSTQRRKVELWARNAREFCLNAYFHVTFTNLLHAVKLRHGTDGFTSAPKEGVLRNFSP